MSDISNHARDVVRQLREVIDRIERGCFVSLDMSRCPTYETPPYLAGERPRKRQTGEELTLSIVYGRAVDETAAGPSTPSSAGRGGTDSDAGQ